MYIVRLAIITLLFGSLGLFFFFSGGAERVGNISLNT